MRTSCFFCGREEGHADTCATKRYALRAQDRAEMKPGSDILSVKDRIADEAKRIVSGARRGAYGTPEDNFARIARFWTAYFQNTGRDLTITPGDVSPMMALLKIARLAETPNHYDSWVDLVGYALTGAEVNKVEFPD